MTTSRELTKAETKTPLWHNVTVRSWAFQLVVLAVVIAFFAYLYNNFRSNTAGSAIPLGFDYLEDRAGFDITGSDFDNNSTMLNAFWYGFLNMVRLVIPGLILTTVLGTIVGVAKLSKNFMVRSAATVYVEAVRNLPLLILLFIFANAVINSVFPRFNSAESDKIFTGWTLLNDIIIISRRGVELPWFVGQGRILFWLFVAGIVVWWLLARWRKSVSERTGELARSGIWGSVALLLIMVVGWFIFGFSVTTPEVIPDAASGAVVRATGGIFVPAGYLAMLAALVVYTSSHIAEIVRGSILAVHRGQGEAASALALTNFQRMWYVVLPQALRTAVPPLGNQYLNLMKNSSLAGVVGYFDLFAVARTGVGTEKPAIPVFITVFCIYLSFSIAISVLVNIYNKRMAYVTK